MQKDIPLLMSSMIWRLVLKKFIKHQINVFLEVADSADSRFCCGCIPGCPMMGGKRQFGARKRKQPR
jgi:hypothetical protein